MRTRLTAITLLLLAAATAFAQTHSGEVTPTWTQPTQPGVGWDSGIYRYDGSGNIARIGDDTFAYDGANRLAYSTIHAYRATTTQSFQYDRYGNVLNVVTDVDDPTDPRDPEPSAFTVDAQTNRLTRLCRGTQPCVSFTYDGAGNQTAHGTQVTYAWDAAGAMTELTGSIAHERYVYDANDERVLLVTLDGTQEVARRWTWRDASNKVAREAVEHVGTNVWSDARDYVYRDGALLASFESSAAPIAERHYHLDHLGTPRLITDAGRNKRAEDVYLPFGEKAAGTSIAYIGHTERMRFTGHERDGEGSPYRPTLDYMHARYYTAEGKRFLSVDPGTDWEPAKPQSWNMYAYVRNSPINATDPDGRAMKFYETIARTADKIGEVAAKDDRLRLVAPLMPEGIQAASSMVAETMRLGDATGEAVYGNKGAANIAIAVAKDTYTAASAVLTGTGIAGAARGGLTVIGNMKQVEQFAAATGAHRMNIETAKWAAMSGARKVGEVMSFAAGAAARLDRIKPFVGGGWTKLEAAVITTTRAVQADIVSHHLQTSN